MKTSICFSYERDGDNLSKWIPWNTYIPRIGEMVDISKIIDSIAIPELLSDVKRLPGTGFDIWNSVTRVSDIERQYTADGMCLITLYIEESD